MSELPVEAAEPAPAATSLPVDPVVKEDELSSAPNTTEESKTDVESDGAKQEKPLDAGALQVEKEEKEGKCQPDAIAKDGEKDGEAKPRTYGNGMLKTSRPAIEDEDNSKYDPSILPETSDPKVIRAQVEFYFSDANLPDDKFLWSKVTEANLPLKLSILCNFARMKRFPYAAVVAALKESTFLTITGEEGAEEVARKVKYDPANVYVSKADLRSVYVKGFGDEEKGSQFDIEAFFTPFGPVNQVRLRRVEGNKFFKGSVFVEFQDEETAKKFLALDPMPLWKGKHPLKVMSKEEYKKLKVEDIRDGKVEPGSRSVFRGRGRGRGNYRGDGEKRGHDNRSKGGDRDPDDWKKRKEEDRASGFKNGRGGNDRGKRGGRGGRGGRGRGRRDDRGPRNDDRNREREEKKGEVKGEAGEVKIEAKEGKGEVKQIKPEAAPANDKKRTREDDGQGNPAKKVDTKPEVTVNAS